MSAVPGHFMNEKPKPHEPEDREDPQSPEHENDSMATFWQWFALAALIFAWIAEATMCADRGF